MTELYDFSQESIPRVEALILGYLEFYSGEFLGVKKLSTNDIDDLLDACISEVAHRED